MIDIQLLGTGCTEFKRLERTVRKAVAELGVEASITLVTEFADIFAYPILGTPALVIDGQIKSQRAVPDEQDVLGCLRASA